MKQKPIDSDWRNIPDLALEVIGSGEPIWLLHGQISSHRYWRQVTAMLEKKHKLFLPDLLGFGDSPKPEDVAYDINTHTVAIKACMDKQGMNRPVTLVGHSMGAQIAIRLALKYPDLVDKLVLSGLPLMPKEMEYKHLGSEFPGLKRFLHGSLARASCHWHVRHQKLVARIIRHLPGVGAKGYDKTLLHDAFQHTWKSYSESMDLVVIGYDSASDLKALGLPIHIVIGELDKISSEVPAMVKRLAKSNISLQLVPEAHHNLPLHHPEIVANAILSV